MQPDQRAQYELFPSNLTRGLLLLDQRFAGAQPSSANALRASSLDAHLRKGVILRVAVLNRCPFERVQHVGQAAKAGLTADAIAVLEGSGPFTSLGTLTPVLAFVDAWVTGPRVPDNIFAADRALLSDPDLATMIVLVGHYMTVARFVETLGIELDPEPSNWTAEE